MTVLDTNFLIDLLRGKEDASGMADSFDAPKTTAINAFELYYGAGRSVNPKKGISEVGNLLKAIDVLEFNNFTAQKAGDIHAELMNSGKVLFPQFILYMIVNKKYLFNPST